MKLTIKLFGSSNCGVCKDVKNKVSILLNKNQFNSVEFYYLDIEKEIEKCGEHLVFSVPTVIILVDEKEVKRFVRTFSIKEIEGILQRYLELINSEK